MEDNLNMYLETESSEGSGDRDFAQEVQISPSAVLRIVDPHSVIKIWRMWPVCDDGKKRPFVIANDFEGDSILARMLGDYHPYKYFKGGILESEKDDITGQKKYIYEAQDPELFLKLLYNNDKSSNNGNWKPKREFLFNCIDRMIETQGDFMGQNWCKVHKHTKILRMPITAFEKLKAIIEQNGGLDEFDLFYEKVGQGRSTKHELQKAGEKNSFAFFGFITDEEKQYEHYDLKKEGALSSAQYVLKYLAESVQRINNILGADYYNEMLKQAEIEKEAWDKSHNSNYTPQQVHQTQVPPVETSKPAQTQTASTPNESQSPPPTQPSIRTRTPVNTINCPYCGESVATTTEVCPKCGQKLMEPCSKPDCQKPFSILLDTCPHCGTKYKLG